MVFKFYFTQLKSDSFTMGGLEEINNIILFNWWYHVIIPTSVEGKNL
jgi:hypothetical protein